jgi:hypothetical protein
MSETYLRIIPREPGCVPPALARERALGVLERAPGNVSQLAMRLDFCWR